MDIGKQLYASAMELIRKRYPVGWGGAAALRTHDGNILTSVAPEIINASSALCIETGAILEAHKLEARVTHTVCLVRKNADEDVQVLTPCGICQELLMYWGTEVLAAVSITDGRLNFRTLQEIQPFHWSRIYTSTADML